MPELSYICMILLSIINLILSEETPPDLCRNPRLDSIEYINDQNMYFFTSGQYYWFIKETDFPPLQENAIKLGNGLKKCDAAYYMNTLVTCAKSSAQNKSEEKAIYIFENTADGNRFMSFDIRTRTWTPPKKALDDHIFGRARIAYFNPIDDMFVYNPTEIYFVQREIYAAVDYSRVCDKPNHFSEPFVPQSINSIGKKDEIDAITLFNKTALISTFKDKFWVLRINEKESKDGKIATTRFGEKPLKTGFFKFKDECPPATGPGLPPPQVTDQPNKPESSENPNSDNEESGGSSGSIIIGVIVVIVIVVAIIVVVVLFAMNKKKPSEGLAKTDPETNKVETAPKPSEKVPSKSGTNAAPVVAQSMPPKSAPKK